MQKFNSVDELVNTIRPVEPIYCIRPNSIKSACSWFKNNFPGNILYAVIKAPNLGSLRETTEDFMACVSVAEKVSK